MSLKKYNDRVAQIGTVAGAVKRVCVGAQFDAGQKITDPKALVQSVTAAAKEVPMFEALGDDNSIAQVSTAWATAIRDYQNVHGEMPRAEILASAGETLAALTIGGEGTSKMFESVANIGTSEGIDIRARTGALILPVALAAATNDAATFVQGGKDEVEVFELKRVAGTGFGDIAKGAEIDEFFDGQFSGLKQVYESPAQPDGSKQNFVVYAYNEDTPATDASAVVGVINNYNPDKCPIRRKSIRILHKGRLVASELDTGNLYGSFKVEGVNYTVSPYTNGHDPAQGRIGFTISPAFPADKGKLQIQFDVDIETRNAVLPEVQHEMDSFKLTPHQSIIAAQHTMISYWTMSREYGIDMRSLQSGTQRNLLAYEKDRRNLRDMLVASQANSTMSVPLTVNQGEYFREKYEELHEFLLLLSQAMLADTKVSGLVGLFCGSRAAALVKSMGAPFFQPAPNYKQVPRIHYAGVLFGKWKIFECPTEVKAGGATLGANDMLGYARGNDFSQAGLIAGDAVPATMYRHGMQPALFSRDTLWEQSFGDISPRRGTDYFRKVTLTL